MRSSGQLQYRAGSAVGRRTGRDSRNRLQPRGDPQREHGDHRDRNDDPPPPDTNALPDAFRERGRIDDAVERSNETIATPRHRFDKAGRFCRIAKRLSQSLHRRAHAVVEIDEGVVGPQALAQLLTSDELARALQ